MRRLIYIPIIHSNTDLGSLAADIETKTKGVLKATDFRKHKAVVESYWKEIAQYWQDKKISGFKIFQDGMPTNGTVGQKMVADLSRKGSINYKIVKQLIEKGAILTKTEDSELLKEEYFLTKALVEKKSFLKSLFAYLRYRLRKNGLLAERDSYIAKRIDESLQEGETGICFLGVYHRMLPKLSPDFTVVYLKNPQKIKEYYQKLISHSHEGEINRLARWLVEPIKIPLGKKSNYD